MDDICYIMTVVTLAGQTAGIVEFPVSAVALKKIVYLLYHLFAQHFVNT